jgi:hypothetical protein
MTDDDLETGKFRGVVETKLEDHGKRISRLEVAAIGVIVYIASRQFDKVLELAQ